MNVAFFPHPTSCGAHLLEHQLVGLIDSTQGQEPQYSVRKTGQDHCPFRVSLYLKTSSCCWATSDIFAPTEWEWNLDQEGGSLVPKQSEVLRVRLWRGLVQGWGTCGPQTTCGPREHFIWPASERFRYLFQVRMQNLVKTKLHYKRVFK